jgi:hypothetical protein
LISKCIALTSPCLCTPKLRCLIRRWTITAAGNISVRKFNVKNFAEEVGTAVTVARNPLRRQSTRTKNPHQLSPVGIFSELS